MKKKTVLIKEEGTGDEPLSRSAKKRNCLALQNMGEELITLGLEERKSLNLPQELDDALDEYVRISDREAKRRQRQYIGRLMRELDTVEIEKAMQVRRNMRDVQAAQFHKIEKLRARIIGVGREERQRIILELIKEVERPVEPEQLAKLLEVAEIARTGKSHGQKTKASKELFRELGRIFASGLS